MARTDLSGLSAGFTLYKEVKQQSSKTSGQLVSVVNPLGVNAFVDLAVVYIKTGSSAACTLDIGTPSTVTSADDLLDGISVNAAANTVYNNITDVGVNGKSRQYLAPGDYLTVSVASGDANGLVAGFGFDVRPFSGGEM